MAASLALGTLSANTTYHFRIVASNAGGTRRGDDAAFQTLPTPAASYAYTGSEQLYTVPARVVAIRVLAVGGQGGSASRGEVQGGLGAQVSGELPVTPGESLYVEVGGDGTVDFGGFNGGGAGGRDNRESGGGGGASDVRTSPLAAGLEPDDRLLVAAGGGGAGLEGGGGGAAGEAGQPGEDFFGPYDAPNVVSGGGAGTASQGGAGSEGHAGVRGSGGEGAASNAPGGGGGGGLFGGGGGGGSVFGGGGGGGGGSSLVPAGGSFELTTPLTAPQVEIFVAQQQR